MHDQLEFLINQCIKQDRSAQSRLYALFSAKMFGVCLRYARSREEGEEILQEGFIKVFANISQFNFEGSFEGWIRKIMVNCALQKFRSKPQLYAVINVNEAEAGYLADETIISALGAKELLKLVQMLPAAYRMVFNLYVFEGLKHREIAGLLGISEGTSKSNLADARSILKKYLAKNEQVAQQKINNA